MKIYIKSCFVAILQTLSIYRSTSNFLSDRNLDTLAGIFLHDSR
jgi:hypothetical protein